MIEFIIPTYNQPKELMTILCSLSCQTSLDWICHVISDGCDKDVDEKNRTFISSLNDDRIRYSRIDGPHKDYGHAARNYGLDNATEEWIVMSGSDNYYVPTFVENFINASYAPDVDLIYCNFVHDQGVKDYQPIPSRLQYGFIDIGNFMCRKDIIRELRIDTTIYEGDWVFLNHYYKRMTGVSTKIDQILYVHN